MTDLSNICMHVIDIIGIHLSPNIEDLYNFRLVCKNTRNACNTKTMFKEFLISSKERFVGYTKSSLFRACDTSSKYDWNYDDLYDILTSYCFSEYEMDSEKYKPTLEDLNIFFITELDELDADYSYENIPRVMKLFIEVIIDVSIKSVKEYFEFCPRWTKRQLEIQQYTKYITIATRYNMKDKVIELLPYCTDFFTARP